MLTIWVNLLVVIGLFNHVDLYTSISTNWLYKDGIEAIQNFHHMSTTCCHLPL